MSDSEAFSYFLTEYKKRLPITDENKDFHEHIDYMINYYKTSEIIYQERWKDWISPNDERYWRDPTESEKRTIEISRKKEEGEHKKTEPRVVIVIASLLLSLLGCFGAPLSVLGGLKLSELIFYGVFMVQGLLTILYELGVIPIGIWSWLY